MYNNNEIYIYRVKLYRKLTEFNKVVKGFVNTYLGSYFFNSGSVIIVIKFKKQHPRTRKKTHTNTDLIKLIHEGKILNIKPYFSTHFSIDYESSTDVWKSPRSLKN